MNYSVLEQKILKTVAYFDLFDFPLTAWEVFRNLYTAQNESYLEISKSLMQLQKIKALEFNQGFYFLPTRKSICSLRHNRYLIAQKKMRWALRYARIIKNLPFVEAIFICNSLAYQNSKESSDIDFAIITKAEHIWTCRFFCASLMALIRRRPTKKTQKNRLCLSFFVADNALNLQPLTYDNDIHFTYWLRQFLPIYDRANWCNALEDNNSSLHEVVPNSALKVTTPRWFVNTKINYSKPIEMLFAASFWEKLFKKIQLKIMPAHLKKIAISHPQNVILTNDILKFHDKDNRQEIKQKWENKIKQICQN